MLERSEQSVQTLFERFENRIDAILARIEATETAAAKPPHPNLLRDDLIEALRALLSQLVVQGDGRVSIEEVVGVSFAVRVHLARETLARARDHQSRVDALAAFDRHAARQRDLIANTFSKTAHPE